MKTSELIGPALDWAVAKCEGFENLRCNPHHIAQHLIMNRGGTIKTLKEINYSTNWELSGPIIEQFSENETTFCLFFNPYKDCPTHSNTYPWSAEYRGARFTATTPLIAAMRCYVASKLGEEVEIPEELK